VLATFQPAFESELRVVTSALMIEHPAASVATTMTAKATRARPRGTAGVTLTR
jgi:hypothetical protein